VVCCYVMRRTSCKTVKPRIPNIRWHIIFSGPRTRTVRPPWLSLYAAIDSFGCAAFTVTNLFRHAMPNAALTSRTSVNSP
jgi:hypothetical protein